MKQALSIFLVILSFFANAQISPMAVGAFASSGQLTPEYKTILNYANTNSIASPFDYWDKYQESKLLKNLKTDGVWAITDQLLPLSFTGDVNFCLINAKAPGTRNATFSGTNFWEKGNAIYSNGTTGFTNTNYAPSTHGVNLTQNNTGVFIRISDEQGAVASIIEFGAADAAAANFTALGVWNTTGNAAIARINAATNFNATNSTAALGNYAVSRSGSTTSKIFKNGSQLGSTSNVASTGLTSKTIYLSSWNSNGTSTNPSTRRLGFYSIGSNLDATISAYNTDLNNFLTTSKAITMPSFPDKTSISNYITSTSQLSGLFQYGEPAQQTLGLTGGDYFSGAVAGNGFAYFSPGSATAGAKINTTTFAVSNFGSFVAGTFKYGGAVYIASSGFVYLIPASSTVVAKINTSTDAITFFDTSGVKGTESGNLGATIQKFYTGLLDPTGRYIFCVPYNNSAVMIIDTSNDTIQFLDTTGIVAGPTGNLGLNLGQWDTGVSYGQFGYGSPSNATDMLKIDMTNFTCSRILTAGFPVGTAKWSSAVVSPIGRYLYFLPYFRNDILKYDTQTDTYITLSTTIGTNNDAKTKVLVAKLMPTGNILLATYDNSLTSNYILDPTNDTFTPFTRQNTTTLMNGSILLPDGSIIGVPNNNSPPVRFSFPRRTIPIPTNFWDNNFVKNY